MKKVKWKPIRLVSLNVWSGRRIDELISFVKNIALTTDIFCFQELFTSSVVFRNGSEIQFDMFSDLIAALPDFEVQFFPMLHASRFASLYAKDTMFGNALFVRRTLTIKSAGGFYAFDDGRREFDGLPHRCGIVQFATVRRGRDLFTVCNFHGIATWPKNDSLDRFKQIEKIETFLKKSKNPVVLCGDFNYFPETEGIKRLGKQMANLTEAFNIETTRSDFHRKKFSGEAIIDTISDYIFIGAEIRALALEVLPVEISDHRPLVFDFAFGKMD